MVCFGSCSSMCQVLLHEHFDRTFLQISIFGSVSKFWISRMFHTHISIYFGPAFFWPPPAFFWPPPLFFDIPPALFWPPADLKCFYCMATSFWHPPCFFLTSPHDPASALFWPPPHFILTSPLLFFDLPTTSFWLPHFSILTPPPCSFLTSPPASFFFVLSSAVSFSSLPSYCGAVRCACWECRL